MVSSRTAEWERLSLEELTEQQTILSGVIRRKQLDAAPPEGWDPFLFGRKKYKATVAQVAPTRLRDTLTAAHRVCALGVSLGSKNSEGARFEACIRWIGDNFDRCALLVGDSIYRYTLQVAEGVDAESARPQAYAKGCEFIETHRPLVEAYPTKCRFEFVLLSEVEKSPDFPRYHDELLDLYENNQPFQELVKGFAGIYLGRGEKAAGEDQATWDRARGIAVAYLLEESALFCCMVDQGLPVLIYPGAIKTFQAIAEGEYPMVPEPLLKMVFVAMRLKESGLFFFDSNIQPSPQVESVFDQGKIEPERHAFLDTVSEEGKRQFFCFGSERQFSAGSAIIRQGQVARTLFVLTEGEIEVVVDEGTPHRRRVAIKEAGSVFGEQAFLDSQPRSATVSALTNCRAICMSPEQFESLRRTDPDLATAALLDIGRVLSSRLRTGQPRALSAGA